MGRIGRVRVDGDERRRAGCVYGGGTALGWVASERSGGKRAVRSGAQWGTGDGWFATVSGLVEL